MLRVCVLYASVVNTFSPQRHREHRATRTIKFIGRFEGDIRDAAHYERIVFADADAKGNIHRMWIAQLESMLPGHRGSYDSKMNNRVQIAPLAFDQQVGRYSFSRSIASKPGGEAEKTKQFLLDRASISTTI